MFFVIEFNKLKNINKKEYSYCSCNSKLENGRLQCECGNDIDIFEWCWKNDSSVNLVLDSNNLEVTFHPIFSSGTAIVSGNKPFLPNRHYYWEIKILSKLYGTDVMVGVGTEKTKNCKSLFCSALGLDDQSYGYSYNGKIQHNKLTRTYGKQYGLGCLVGVHLDLYAGVLEYYLNREPLGIAFDDLREKQLYPMVCSTAAQSTIKLNCAISEEETLQSMCLKCVTKNQFLYDQFKNIPGLYKYYNKKYFWLVSRRDFEEKSRQQEDDELHLMTMSKALSKTRHKKRISKSVWDKPSKKITKTDSTEMCVQPDHTGPSSSVASKESSLEKQESDEICRLLYDCLSDCDNDNSSDSYNNVEIRDGKISFIVPVESDSDSSS